MQADGFGMNDQLSLIIKIRIAHIRLNGHVRLAAGVELVFHHHICLFKQRCGIRTLFNILIIVDIGSADEFMAVGSHCFRSAHIGGQHFKVDFHLGRGGAGVRFGIRADNGIGVAVLEDLLVAEDGAIESVSLVGGKGDQTADAVIALHILGRKHGGDAGHPFCFRSVYAPDVGMGNRSLSQGQVQGIRRQLVGHIRAVKRGPGHTGHGAGTRTAGAPYGAVGRLLVFQFRGVLFSAHDGSSIHDGIYQRLISGAAAGIAVILEPVAHLFTGRLGIMIKESLGRHDETGSAETALRASVQDPRLLQRMQMSGGTYAFQGG